MRCPSTGQFTHDWCIVEVLGPIIRLGSHNTIIYRDCNHYSDVIMALMASQITRFTIVYSAVCLGADQRKCHSSVNPRTKVQQREKCFHLITSSWINPSAETIHGINTLKFIWGRLIDLGIKKSYSTHWGRVTHVCVNNLAITTVGIFSRPLFTIAWKSIIFFFCGVNNLSNELFKLSCAIVRTYDSPMFHNNPLDTGIIQLHDGPSQ